jgi:tRNA(Arg) A34 adenosine deaminase TadA
MSKEKTYEIGQQCLMKLEAATKGIETWKAYLLEYQPRVEYPDNAFVWLTCALALKGVATGNFGVGAILIDDGGQTVAQGHNEVFYPYFRSDRHAEMVVLDDFEEASLERGSVTIYTSLEPCPMCLVRLSTSSVRKVLFAAPDLPGGMVCRINNLPPFWIELAQSKTFGQAQCSPDLVHAAHQIFLLNLAELTAQIKAR